ncbi:hypothetical protein LCGC14_0830800, partial [marine sediment metagenome]
MSGLKDKKKQRKEFEEIALVHID